MSSAVDEQEEDSDEEETEGLISKEEKRKLNIKITKKYSTEEGYDEITKSYTCRQCGSAIKSKNAGLKFHFARHVKNSHDDWLDKVDSPEEIVFESRASFLPLTSEVFNRPQDDEQFDDEDYAYYGVGGPLGAHVDDLKNAYYERKAKLEVNEQVQKDFNEFLGFEHKKL